VCAAARIGRGTDQQRATRNTQILSLLSSTEAYKFHAVSQRFQWIMLRIAVQELFFHLKKMLLCGMLMQSCFVTLNDATSFFFLVSTAHLAGLYVPRSMGRIM
jgi:hypothetical protein